MQYFDATTEAVLVQIAFVVVAIVVAWVVLSLLKGTAQVQQKGVQFGGAAAMFVATFFLLNKYVPEIRDGIVAEAHAAQSQQLVAVSAKGPANSLEVYISPEQQVISERDLKALDKNKYYVNEQMGVAVLTPSDPGWSVGEVSSIELPSVADSPFLSMSLRTMKVMPLFSDTSTSSSVFSVTASKAHTIILNGDTEIAGFRLDINPLSDEKFMESMLEAQLDAAATMGADSGLNLNDPDTRKSFISNMMTAVGSTIKDQFDKTISKAFPASKNMRNGVYVTRLTFNQSKAGGELFQALNSTETVLDRAVSQLSLSGLFFGGGHNLKVDQRRGIASFDNSFELRNVFVDGRKTDVRVNHIGFLVAAGESAVYVQLLCLDSDGIDVSLFLKKVMDSLLFVV
jgi:hypothetical protein